MKCPVVGLRSMLEAHEGWGGVLSPPRQLPPSGHTWAQEIEVDHIGKAFVGCSTDC